MDCVEGRAALLDVVADGVDDRRRALDGQDDRRLVPDVGADDLDPAAPGVVAAYVLVAVPAVPANPLLPEGCALGVAHGHPNVVPLGGQALHDPAAEEPRAPEHGYRSGRHRRPADRFPAAFRQMSSTGTARRSRSARPELATASSASGPRMRETARWGGLSPASTTARARAE